MRDGSLNGSRRRKRSLISLKIAVFAPIPSASVRTATRVNPGDLRSWRRANLRSFILLVTEGHHRIDIHGATRGKIAGNQRRGGEQRENNGVSDEVIRAHAEKQ